MGDPAGEGREGPLEVLMEVQSRDLRLDQLAYKRRALDERADLSRIEETSGRLLRRLSELAVSRDALAKRQGEIEGHVLSYTDRITTIEKRLAEGGAYREVQAMSAETESLARHRRELEDKELEVMEELEPVEAEIASVERELGDLGPQRELAEKALVMAESEIDSEMGSVRAERQVLADRLPEQLAATYESLRARLDGIGAARLVDGHCGGCHLQLPSSERERLVRAPPGTVTYCDQCGRILVP